MTGRGCTCRRSVGSRSCRRGRWCRPGKRCRSRRSCADRASVLALAPQHLPPHWSGCCRADPWPTTPAHARVDAAAEHGEQDADERAANHASTLSPSPVAVNARYDAAWSRSRVPSASVSSSASPRCGWRRFRSASCPTRGSWPSRSSWVGCLHRSHRARPASSPHLDTAPNGSGDFTAGWLQLALLVALSLVATVVWSVADCRRTDYPRLRQWLHVYLRFAVGTIMIGYGLAKVYHSQFPFPSPAKLEQPYGDASPMGLCGPSWASRVPTTCSPGWPRRYRRCCSCSAARRRWSDRARRGDGQRRGAQLLLRRAGQTLLDRADASVAVYRGAAFARSSMCWLPSAPSPRRRRRRCSPAQPRLGSPRRSSPSPSLATSSAAASSSTSGCAPPSYKGPTSRACQCNTREFRLLTRGFHWVNESPYNR